jgi:heme exporter protein A
MVARLAGVATGSARVGEVLELVGLAGARQRRAGRCSAGMLRRADLGRALLTAPRLLLLDEPHVGLDPAAAGLVGLAVAAVRRRGGAVLAVSHEPRRLQGLVDATVELADGRLWWAEAEEGCPCGR